ncbi:MAG: sugar transferase [Bacteroidia bacterium]
MYTLFFKRIIDVIVSFFTLLLSFPVFAIICILLYKHNNGKVFFTQKRPGLDEKIFKLIKFKTMNDKVDSKGNLLPSIERTTSVGRFLRKYSLDEIPQLINVLKGDMSLIGPRPLLVQYLPLYNEYQKQRHTVKPGITGWAQTNGRNAISWSKKFELDVFYVKNISLILDVKIILNTIVKVVKGSDVNVSKDKTVETFNGHN